MAEVGLEALLLDAPGGFADGGPDPLDLVLGVALHLEGGLGRERDRLSGGTPCNMERLPPTAGCPVGQLDSPDPTVAFLG